MNKAIEIFNQAEQVIRELETPSMEAVVALSQAALAMVKADLEIDNIAGAIDTMHKTKAIEDYVKSRIKSQHGKITVANEVTITRLMELREIGWWLDENTFNSTKEARNSNRVSHIGVGYRKPPIYQRIPLDMLVNGEKPKYFDDELGISSKQRVTWKAISKVSQEEFEAFIKPYRENGDLKRENELTFFRFYSHATAKPTDKPERTLPEEIKTREGIALYNWMRDGKDRIMAYVELLREEGAPVSEVMVLAGLPFWKNVVNTWKQLSALVDVGEFQYEDETSND